LQGRQGRMSYQPFSIHVGGYMIEKYIQIEMALLNHGGQH